MNVIIWNCRGALKPNFQNHVKELVRIHNPTILVLMETRIGGERARGITDRLPFENAIHTDTIGLAGGLWMLWNLERVDVTPLSSTEQEIHAVVKVPNSDYNWLFFAIYASPGSAKRDILWNNLIKVAELYDMMWVLAGDFNEPLMGENKFGGRPVEFGLGLSRHGAQQLIHLLVSDELVRADLFGAEQLSDANLPGLVPIRAVGDNDGGDSAELEVDYGAEFLGELGQGVVGHVSKEVEMTDYWDAWW
ncbi:hypothetical protein SO802_004374 [Lithocarpus litseifolius]|uniref:Endonuclease/exonuclease/phosphatase domain-containing protein n=1 Tax=Lithocarpus litseifolius TaxID=425828 RepID=A0AAW2E6P8_9ROSI